MKRILFIFVFGLTALCLAAQPISQLQAKERAIKFLQSAHSPALTRSTATAQPQLTAAPAGADRLYAFNIEGGGYVIASGDERVLPVLGYSTTGTFDCDGMPGNMRSLLLAYSEAISSMGNAFIIPSERQTARAAHPVVEPLLRTRWAQWPFYNDLCPLYNGQAAAARGQRTLTGCGATSMAQVMNYYQWPKEVTTEIPAYDYEVSNIQREPLLSETFHLDALPPVSFDWANMRNHYRGAYDEATGDYTLASGTTPEQVKAVATLMRYCGQAIQMSYSTESSLAWTEYVAQTMPKYFGYDKGMRTVYRCQYGIDEWENVIYHELASARPVIYYGSSSLGGHIFVCDGYDGQGYFHINWGWEDSSDNYFSLSVLNIYASGDSVIPGYDFSTDQAAVIGIQPARQGSTAAADKPKLSLTSNIYVASMNDTEYEMAFDVLYSHIDYPEANFMVNLCIEDPQGHETVFIRSKEPMQLKANKVDYCDFYIYKQQNLPDGTYKLYPRAQWQGEAGGEWVRIGGQVLYAEMTVSGGVATMRQMPYPDFEMKGCRVKRGTGLVGKPSEVALTIGNKGRDYQGLLMVQAWSIGSDDPQTAFANMRNGLKYPKADSLNVAAFLRGGQTTDLNFTMTPRQPARLLLTVSEYIHPSFVLGTAVIDFPAQATAISGAEAATAGADSPWYSLSGQLVGRPGKGVYIRNGRKIVRR